MGDKLPVYRREIILLISVIVVCVSSTFAAMSWVETRIDDHASATKHDGAVSHREFSTFTEQVLDRLRSIEDAIRER